MAEMILENIPNADWIHNLLYDNILKEQQDTAIIAFDLTQDKGVISILGEGNGWVEPDDLHMTLLFLGTVDRLDKDLVLQKLALLSTMQAPIEGEFTGYGIFNPSENDSMPVVLLYDSPQLPVLHDSLRKIFNDEREATHGFIPHVTLAYVDKPVDFQKYDKAKVFDQISLWWGEEHYTYNLSGNIVEKGGQGSGHFGHSGRPGRVGGSRPGVDYGAVDIDYHSRFWNEEAAAMLEQSKGLFVSDEPTAAEIKVVYEYTQKYFRTINSQLRKGELDAAVKRRVAKIDSAISKSTVTDDVYVYRGGMRGGTDKAYTSASMSRQVAASFAAGEFGKFDYTGVSRILVPAGSNALFIPSDYTQKRSEAKQFEVLLPRDSVFVEIGTNDYELVSTTVEKELPVDEESIKRLIDIRISIFYDESDTLAEQMFTGDISLGQWEESMKQLIRGVHTSTAAIGKGGWDEMSWSDWGRLGTVMREQYRYLHGFAETINSKRDSISLKAIQARARLYGNASGLSAALTQAGADIESQLPWIPKDGSTQCLVNCKCVWVLEIIDTMKDGTQVVQATWRIRPAEHCPDCIERNNYVHMVYVPKDVKVPVTIGGF